MPIIKENAIEVTKRFLEEMDRIVIDRSRGRRGADRVTAEEFAANVGATSSNINRMRKDMTRNNVTVESCVRLIKVYGTDPSWLILGDNSGSMEGRLKELEKKVAAIMAKHPTSRKTSSKKA